MVLVPAFWEERGLISKGTQTGIAAFHVLVVGNDYAVSTTAAMFYTAPTEIKTVSIGDVDYMACYYKKGDTYIANRNLVRSDTLAYNVFDVLFDKGRIPWYLEYEDIGKAFDSFKDFADVNFNVDHAILEIVAANIARQPNNRNKYFRHQSGDALKKRPSYIPLRNVQYGATNTTAKLTGAYWDQGQISGLLEPSQRTEMIEDLLRR